MAEVTRELARYVLRAEPGALPEAVRHQGVRAFVNFVGCTLGGCRDPSVDLLISAFRDFAGPPQATVVGRGERLDMLRAALVNCLSSSQHSYNDTHLKTVAHPTGPVAAPLLALAEYRGMTGAELLHALILGIEVQCRVGNMLVTPPARAPVGLSTQSVLGVIGAAVAAAKVMRLGEQQMVWALGIASALAAGHRETHATMASNLVPANAARCGLEAALLAAKGFTCGDAALEGPKGFASVFARDANPAAALEGLGSRYEILSLTYKPYPCGIVIHPVIDACLELARRHDVDPAAIERVELTVSPLTVALCGIRPEPQDSHQAGVSLHHWVAAAFIHRRCGVAEGADRWVHDPAMIALRRRVAATADPGTRDDETRAAVTLKDGQVLRSHVEHARGSLDRPLSDDDLAEKFRGQAGGVLDAGRTEALLAACWSLAEVTDMRAWVGEHLGRMVRD